MNLVGQKSKVSEKSDLWKETSPAERLGKTVWLFFPDQRDQGEDRP